MYHAKENLTAIGRAELAEYYDLKREIAAQTRRVEEIERQIRERERGYWMFGTSKRRWDELPESLIQTKIGLEVSIILDLEKLQKRAAAIENAVQGVENPLHRELLRKRYLDGMDWNAIADAMNYVPRQCQRILNTALKLLEHTQRVDDTKSEK